MSNKLEHNWYEEHVPAYALGITDRDESAAVESHVRACESCRALVAEYRMIGDDLLYGVSPAAAPPRLNKDLRRKLRAAEGDGEARRWTALFRQPGLALGLAALVLLVMTNIYWATRIGQIEDQAAELARLAEAPTLALRPSEGVGGWGTVYIQPGGKLALVCVYDLPQLTPEKTYQVWLVKGTERQSAGTFQVSRQGFGVLFVRATEPLSNFESLGITIEPAGGSSAPTTPRVMGGAL